MLSFYYLNIMINELDKSVCSTQIVPKAFLDTKICMVIYPILSGSILMCFQLLTKMHWKVRGSGWSKGCGDRMGSQKLSLHLLLHSLQDHLLYLRHWIILFGWSHSVYVTDDRWSRRYSLWCCCSVVITSHWVCSFQKWKVWTNT